MRRLLRFWPTLGDRTRVTGSTWYRLDIHPAPYFALIADYVVARIPLRVPDHIKAVSARR